jgi:serine/threonine-protein kinase
VNLVSGSIIGYYTVLSRIGKGGMGEIYLAEDSRLGRKVAIKLLPEALTKDSEQVYRFEQEARAASALNHPNIITIYEVGEAGSSHFIATEYIDGETLRERLSRERMNFDEILDVAIQIASALAAAHKVGIVHRDIKPENIMLRPDGYVKVLDFGLAKLTESPSKETEDRSDSSPLSTQITTNPGVIIGTPNYMSPEQARGLTIDARTDIFSFGAMLYEMIAGRRPFDGSTVSDILVSVLTTEPTPLRNLAPGIPPRLERIVVEAMAKKKSERTQSINETLSALRKQKRLLEIEAGVDETIPPESITRKVIVRDAIETVREAPILSEKITDARATLIAGSLNTRGSLLRKSLVPALIVILLAVIVVSFLMWNSKQNIINSMAVLPFANLSRDPNAEYLSDGMTESLINNLSRLPNVKVLSRNAVFRYKGTEPDAATIGREMNVRAVLFGRVEQTGDDLSISVELVNAQDNTSIWGKKYRRKMSDVLALQEEIARQVSEKLHPDMTGEEKQRLAKKYTESSDAYRLYLQGRYYWNKRTVEGMRRGIEFFDRAIAFDPNYALAYAGLADCYSLLGEYGAIPTTETVARAGEAATRAIEIDDTLAEAHTSLAAVREYEWKWADAEAEYKRAIESNPNYATARHWYGVYLSSMGRFDESVQELKAALELDPVSPIINTGLGRAYYSARNYDRALDQYRKTLDMEPNFAEARFQLALTYEGKRMYEEAAVEYEKSANLFDDKTMMAWVARAHALAGRRDEAEHFLKELDAMSRERYVSPYFNAMIYAALGDKDRAMEGLERVYQDRSYYVVWLKIDTVFDSMRDDPRFQELLRKIGLVN